LDRAEEISVVNDDSETRVAEVAESTLASSTSTVEPSDQQQTVSDDVSQMEHAWHVQCKNTSSQCVITFSFVHSFIHSFILSFIHSFIHYCKIKWVYIGPVRCNVTKHVLQTPLNPNQPLRLLCFSSSLTIFREKLKFYLF